MSDLTDLKDHLDGLVGDDPWFDVVDWAVNEIEQSQAAIVTWKEEEAAWKITEARLLARVGKLDSQNNLLRSEVERWNVCTNNICNRLVTRCGVGVASDIACQETLAARQDIGERCFDLGHHITNKMIDAAVEYANTREKSNHAQWIWTALNKLNIFQCKHRPFGGARSIEPGEHLNERCPTCAHFTGHGWTIGGEDQ